MVINIKWYVEVQMSWCETKILCFNKILMKLKSIYISDVNSLLKSMLFYSDIIKSKWSFYEGYAIVNIKEI